MDALFPDVPAAFGRLQALRDDIRSGRQIEQTRVSRAALRAMLPSLGITRVGDLTALDCLSIPVWFAARPGSRSLCVSNGKGVTEDAAWLSAVMESAEQAIAEDAASLVTLVDTQAGLARRGLRAVPLDRQSRCAAPFIPPEQEIAWVEGLSWATGEAVYAPYELVGMDMSSNAPWSSDTFRIGSLGLASGGDLLSAMLHGLRELLEDDAMFGPLAGGIVPAARRPLGLSRRHTELHRMVSMLEGRGVECLFAAVEDDIAEPVVIAALRPMDDSRLAYFCGSACRPTREDAALAALLEAVQSRLTFISGARDDLFADDYGEPLKRGTEALFSPYYWIDEAVPETPAPESFAALAGKLSGLGTDIYVFPLGGARFGFEVVRVLADDLVSVQGPANYARGGRAGLKLLRSWGQT